MGSEKQRRIQRRARIGLVSFCVLVLIAIFYLTANVSLMNDVDEDIDTFMEDESK